MGQRQHCLQRVSSGRMLATDTLTVTIAREYDGHRFTVSGSIKGAALLDTQTFAALEQLVGTLAADMEGRIEDYDDGKFDPTDGPSAARPLRFDHRSETR